MTFTPPRPRLPIRTPGSASSHMQQCSPTAPRFGLSSVLMSNAAESRRHEILQPPNIMNCYSDAQFVSKAAKALLYKIKETILVEDEEGNSVWSGKYAIIGLSGGSTPRLILEACCASMCSEAGARLDWCKVLFFLVDERYVPETDPDSNTKMIKETLINNSPIPEDNFLYPDTSLPLEECVCDYERRLGELFQFSRPTIVTLGLGPDGHLASWFPPLSVDEAFQAFDPFHYVCHTTQDRFAVKDRITVSMHLILSAKCKLFFIKGQDKIDVYRNIVAKHPNKESLREEPMLQVLRSQSVHVVCFPPLEHDEVTEIHTTWAEKLECLSLVILGASGDLAVKKTFPATFSLYVSGHFPENFHISAYARSDMTVDQLWQKICPKLHSLLKSFDITEEKEATQKLEGFKSHLSYHRCKSYDDDASATELHVWLRDNFEAKYKLSNRLFYLALPPNTFGKAVACLRKNCWASETRNEANEHGWTRVVVEKPFGRDSESSRELSTELAQHAKEEELFRIDHYLGKEMVLNLFVLRFANIFLAPLWHRHYVKSVRITFKETGGTEGRGGYFDNYGIIRDVLQNHLLQLVSLVAMERPVSLVDEDVRDEKVKVLRCIQPCKLENTVIGQYTGSESMPGYKEDSTVPDDSKCATFCVTALNIQNERWQGVPFILKAGKALETQVAEIRIQFHDVLGNMFSSELPQNELVLRIQPNDAIYLKCLGKQPGLGKALVETELDLTVMERFNISRVNDAYERLLLDVIKGDKKNFVRSDELREAWRIFTPVLHDIENKKIEPELYAAGSRGPELGYKMIRSFGYQKHDGYVWSRR